MILFVLRTLAEASKRVPPHEVSLVTRLLSRASYPFDSDLVDTLERTERALVEDLKKSSEGGTFTTTSTTFKKNSPFTMLWVLEALPNIELLDCNFEIELVQTRVAVALQEPAGARWDEVGLDDQKEFQNPTIALRVLRWCQLGNRVNQLGGSVELDKQTRKWFVDRILRQLALSEIPHSYFDIADLIFATEGLLLCEHRSENHRPLLERVMRVVLDAKLSHPRLRALEPLSSTAQGEALLPLSVEAFLSLIRVAERAAPTLLTFEEELAERMSGYVDWLLAQRREISVGTHRVWGWRSEHTRRDDLVHPWQTSQILLFLAHYDQWIRNKLQTDLLKVSRFSCQPQIAKEDFWPEETSTNFRCFEAWQRSATPTNEAEKEAYGIYQRVFTSFIEPRQQAAGQAKYSMLLYGPPGTGKTTFLNWIAQRLSWPLVTITPSDFLVQGSEGVERRAKAIFDTLLQLQDVVVLFDEIDRLILDRAHALHQGQQDFFQFMTPSMLPKLNNLRRAEKVIFAIATNFEERIDPAIVRRGRIDERFLVLPPDEPARRVIGRRRAGRLYSSNSKFERSSEARFTRSCEEAASRGRVVHST